MNEYNLAITFIISVLTLKIVAFILGYKIVKLGHDTLIRGVSGELDFGFSGKIIGAKLKSASPGAFFVLMGSAIILWGLTIEKPFDYENVRTEKTPITVKDTLIDKPPLFQFDK